MKVGQKPGMPAVGQASRSSGDAEIRSGSTQGKSPKAKARKSSKRGYLDGQMLIAMPSMGDERFTRTVIYVCAHSSEGAMGIIVNQPAPHISFRDLLVQLDVVADADKIQLPPHAHRVKVLKGGPV